MFIVTNDKINVELSAKEISGMIPSTRTSLTFERINLVFTNSNLRKQIAGEKGIFNHLVAFVRRKDYASRKNFFKVIVKEDNNNELTDLEVTKSRIFNSLLLLEEQQQNQQSNQHRHVAKKRKVMIEDSSTPLDPSFNVNEAPVVLLNANVPAPPQPLEEDDDFVLNTKKGGRKRYDLLSKVQLRVKLIAEQKKSSKWRRKFIALGEKYEAEHEVKEAVLTKDDVSARMRKLISDCGSFKARIMGEGGKERLTHSAGMFIADIKVSGRVSMEKMTRVLVSALSMWFGEWLTDDLLRYLCPGTSAMSLAFEVASSHLYRGIRTEVAVNKRSLCAIIDESHQKKAALKANIIISQDSTS